MTTQLQKHNWIKTNKTTKKTHTTHDIINTTIVRTQKQKQQKTNESTQSHQEVGKTIVQINWISKKASTIYQNHYNK